ncbi:MAG: response regulator [Myxococcales bacterium]|nr:response regulator [Myxococcales bacterium]MCB9755033.1 response regulator [Myxococcales bacterium]
MRILFVENHAPFAATVGEAFLAAHYLTLVGSVADALAFVAEGRFDCVLVDHDLDDGPGTLIVEALRARGFSGPIVATSAHDEGNAALQAAGATHVCKKSQFHTLAALLERVGADAGE